VQTRDCTVTFKCEGCGVRKPEAKRDRLRSAFTVCSQACLDTAQLSSRWKQPLLLAGRRPPARASRWRGALRATPWPGVCQGGQGGRADPRRGHQREQGGRGWADAGRWDCVKSGFIFPILTVLCR
jgi:hypothetical protein